MCGIVGYIGQKNATDILIDGLRRLEYRGYDSAGVAIRGRGGMTLVRSEGKLAALEKKIRLKPPRGHLGIGHTRWATHGRPSETNAHPHKAGPVVLVHNGIIENYIALRNYLTKKGHTIKSETDTELASHLIQQRMYDGLSMEDAFRKALSEIQGSYAFVVMNEKDPDRLYIARNGSPLIVGIGKKENLVASDVSAVLPYTRKVIYLEDKDVGMLTQKGLKLWDENDHPVQRPIKEITWSQSMAEKGGYKHFMLKEIVEQPRALTDTLAGRIIESRHGILLDGAESLLGGRRPFEFNKLYIVACGTSYHAGLVGKYLIEEFARVPVMVDHASEFRYRNPIVDSKTLVITLSQSGETADTLAAAKDAKNRGARILSICNVIDSSLPRMSDATLYTHAGPEIGVASTKAFTTQLALFVLLALRLGFSRKIISQEFVKEVIEGLTRIPEQMETVLKMDARIRRVATKYSDSANFLYFGRGVHYPISMEGALKLKELSYIHAEAYPAGEMKHGPIALIDHGVPMVVLVPQDKTYEKVLSNIEEVRARGARIIAIGTEGDDQIVGKCEEVIALPKVPWYLTPLLASLPLQMLAYHIADHKGTDVDQPRNLAKSVTVE